MNAYDIIDIELLDHVETLYPGWSIYVCIAHLSDGEQVTGTVQSDGLFNHSIESFEADDEDPI